MILKSVETPRGVIVNVPEREAREIFGASNEAITAARREVMLEVLRNERNALLRACDWTQVPDAALTTEQKAAWPNTVKCCVTCRRWRIWIRWSGR